MPTLLFDSSGDALKISELDIENKTVKIWMENDEQGAEYSVLEANIDLHDLEILSKWLDTQIDDLKEINKTHRT